MIEAAVSVGIIRLLATRRADLIPESLRNINRQSLSATNTTILFLTIICLSGCAYEGIDGTVFGTVAESSGRPPTESIVDLSQGELGLAMSILILFGLGFMAGRSWERIFHGDE